jgi:hypothetical protein
LRSWRARARSVITSFRSEVSAPAWAAELVPHLERALAASPSDHALAENRRSGRSVSADPSGRPERTQKQPWRPAG